MHDTMLFYQFQELALKLLLYQDVNVICVDWGGGSASMYSTSAANTRLVGLEVADMIHFLKVCYDKPNFVSKTYWNHIIDGVLEIKGFYLFA